MNLEPPQPPTAPAPAIRPTPPTPPRIDRSPFVKENSDSGTQKSDDAYENMARDAVANGSGALTKRTVDRGDETPRTANSALPAQIEDTQSDYDRGQDVLREFQALDARESQTSRSFSYDAEQAQIFTPKINHQEEHGGVFWIFTIVFVAIAAFIIVKKFLLTGKPTLTKSQLFDDKIKATSNKSKPSPADKISSRPKNKKDDDKGKHFEVRI